MQGAQVVAAADAAAAAQQRRLAAVEARLDGALATGALLDDDRLHGAATAEHLERVTHSLQSKMMKLAEASDGCWQDAMASIEQVRRRPRRRATGLLLPA